MIMEINAFLLWFAVAWPLLLAIPALHSRLPWSSQLAIVPAVLLLLLPADSIVSIPWLLFGTGFTLDSNIRWILAMSIIVWLIAANLDKGSNHGVENKYTTTFFLLTMAGQLGALLSTELVAFFSFSTLMGYSFYGLLMEGSDARLRRAGRTYLIFLVLADLALFEALLLAAFSSDNLHYSTVRRAMAVSYSSEFYFWIAFIGFAFKAGIWPAHLWLSALYSSAPVSRTVMLAGVPVTMALLGMLRWLAFEDYGSSGEGMLLQILGLAAIGFATLKIFTTRPLRLMPEWINIAVTGLLITALGRLLAAPDSWQQYANLAYPLIAITGIVLAVFSLATEGLRKRQQRPEMTPQPLADMKHSAKQWTQNRWYQLQSLWHSLEQLTAKSYQRLVDWQKPFVFRAGWSTRISLFVLLGLLLAWLAHKTN